MRAVVQRVTYSSVEVDGVIVGEINKGFNVGGEEAKKFYDKFIEMMKETGLKVETGIFGADMKVDIKNDGPVTILLDSSKNF